MSGCAVCVYDLYEDALETYRDELSLTHREFISKNIPKALWPMEIKQLEESGRSKKKVMSTGSASMDAFKQLELRLKEKNMGK